MHYTLAGCIQYHIYILRYLCIIYFLLYVTEDTLVGNIMDYVRGNSPVNRTDNNDDVILLHMPVTMEELSQMNTLYPNNGNASFYYNSSRYEEWTNLTMNLDLSVLHKFQSNLRVSHKAFLGLLLIYSVFMLVGGAGNSVVLAAFVRNPSFRTARNIFLLNLAVADLLLCLLTMPLTLLEVVTQHWPLGGVACRAAGTLQAAAVFASTLTIVAIALDRYIVSTNVVLCVALDRYIVSTHVMLCVGLDRYIVSTHVVLCVALNRYIVSTHVMLCVGLDRYIVVCTVVETYSIQKGFKIELDIKTVFNVCHVIT